MRGWEGYFLQDRTPGLLRGALGCFAMPMLQPQRLRIFCLVIGLDNDRLLVICFKDLIALEASNIVDPVAAHHEFGLCVFAVRHRAG